MPDHLRYLTRNVPRYSCNNIIIIVTNVILEFLSARFVHPGARQLTILFF